MAKFGQYLCNAGALTESQLEEALSHQSVYGARLGSNLVELRMLSIEQLAEHLGAYHRARLPPRAWLERPRRAALKKVTRPLVERFRFIPLRLEGNVMHAAVLDPADPGALDDLRFATGCRVQAYVLPEIWMHDWLLTLFRVPRGIRHINTSVAPVSPTSAEVAAPAAAPAALQVPGMPAQVSTVPNMPVPNVPGLSLPGALDASGADPMGHTGAVPGMAPITMEKLASALNNGMVGAFSPNSAGGVGGAVGAEPLAAVGAEPSQVPVEPTGREGTAGPGAGNQDNGGQVHANPDTDGDVSDLPAMSFEAPVVGGRQGGAGQDETERRVLDGASVRPPPIAFPALNTQRSGTEDEPAPLVSDPFSQEASNGSPQEQFAIPVDEVAVDFGTMEEPSVVRSRLPVAMHSREPVLPTGLRLAKSESLICLADNREHMLEQAFVIGGVLVSHFSLFIVQQGTIQGGGAVVNGERSDNSGVLVSVDTPCILTQAASSNEGGRFEPESGGLDARLLQLLGDEGCQEACLFPVLIKHRVVNVLFASNGAEAVGSIAYAALEKLALQMGEGYQAIIRARKSKD